MGVIKLGFISLVVFALLITGISLFFPSHIRISKAIDISAGKDSVLSQLSDMSNWKNWYPGADTMQLILAGGETIGLSDQRGVISLSGRSDSTVVATMGVPGKRKAITGWNIYDGSIPNAVTVQWYMDFYLRWYPWEKFSSLLLEKRYGPILEQGLDKLKMLLEK
jgi:Polyketide cyclase / dehydrase and lipid transport